MKCPHCLTEQYVVFVIHDNGRILVVECNKCELRFHVWKRSMAVVA